MNVLTYGEAMALFIAQQAGELERAETFLRRVAGADLNVATGLARLGFDVTYLTRLGDDSLGRQIRAAIAAEGIRTECITIDAHHPTGFQLKSRALDGSDPVVEYFRRGSAASHLSPEDFDASLVENNQHLHLTGVAPAISASSYALAEHLAGSFRDAGRSISFDPNLRPSLWPSRQAMVDALNALARHADWVLPGLGEGRVLTGAESAEGIADFYLERGAQGVFVKLGADGAYWAHVDGRRERIPAVPVREVIDTVGAGDGFAVGVISALLSGLDFDAAARRGALIGALAVQALGDSEGLPDSATLAAFETRQASRPSTEPSV